MTTGIYEIVCTGNGKRYIGQSINIEKRFREHRNQLKRGVRENKYFQNAWNKYGESSFEFNILEECDEDVLTSREQYHMNLHLFENLFNWGPAADNGLRGTKRPSHIVERIRESKIGDKNPMYGKRFSESHRQKLSIAQSGENNGFYGLKHTEETKARMSDAKKGEKSYRAKLTWDKVREIRKRYEEEDISYAKLSRDYGVGENAVAKIVRNERWVE